MPKIELAPLHIPLNRRVQTACVTAAITFPFVLFALNAFCMINATLRPFYLAYLAWMIFDNKVLKTPYKGRQIAWIRHLPFWRQFRDFFPMKLVCETKLSGDKPYLLSFHPHGIVGLSVWGNIATQSNQGIKTLGVDCRIATVSANFWIPFWRDYVLGMGFVDAGKSSFTYLLSRNQTIGVVVGGAAESLNARPGTNDLTLLKRLGFVKQALLHGASIVPVFSFGENDLYDQVPNPPGSFIRRLQQVMQSILGFTVPFFFGRGIFNYSFGLLPHRRPVTMVVGEPIPVKKDPNFTNQDVEAIHKKYMEALQKLHDKYKEQFKHYDGTTSNLRFVE
eukprot:TRINITY_DN1808_c0_g9_i1.p1 TRINITY_DN1808_c0_g9~~TRINITY_DN1808_c0_g9_i1.p1  ORF type:complete len:335 (-),score=76.34 TRINITY_DN1808_c0_g9_i1:106-1110(-)